jgi:heme-degrading monooxygenase HmoA
MYTVPGARSLAGGFWRSVGRRKRYRKCEFRRVSTMISRVWHGWTSREHADAYEGLLRTEIFTGIASRKIQGYRGIHLFRRDVADGVEFVTVMWFDSLEAVKAFAGEDYEAAVVPPKARQLLSRFDERSAHYDVVVGPTGPQP